MHHTFKSTESWTMKSRNQLVTKDNRAQSRPGPGDYDVKPIFKNSGSISRPTQKRELCISSATKNPVPGPGSYEAMSHIQDGEKRSISLRNEPKVKPTPGPMDYQVQLTQSKTKNPNFSISTKSKSYQDLQYEKNAYKPSPVQYNPEPSHNKPKSAFMPTDKRKDLDENERTPGPTAYDLEKTDRLHFNTKASWKLGTQNRNGVPIRPETTPGPAGYEASSDFSTNLHKKKGPTLRDRQEDLIKKDINKLPGPGAYQSGMQLKTTNPLFSLSKSKRETFIDSSQKCNNKTLNPGSYNPTFASTKYHSKSVSQFPSSKRKSLYENEKTPSPFQYHNSKNQSLRKAPTYSLSAKHMPNQYLQEKIYENNPGPGNYNASEALLKKKIEIHKIPEEKRPDFEKERAKPGPGFYDIAGKEKGPNWGFSKQKKMAFTDEPNEAKFGQFYEIRKPVTNPPGYQRVVDKDPLRTK